jgi:SAM-dependent methyltransferase
MELNKTHWYDGWFYDRLIAPNQDRLFSEIKKLIKPDSRILDVGCGTGRFSFYISEKCSLVKGIDISKKNIDRANSNLVKKPDSKIIFKHTTLNHLITNKEYFDYAVSTYVIHEVNPEDRITLLKEMSEIADKIIIGDYLSPHKPGFWNILNEIVEFGAGSEHYRNYKHFMANGGLQTLAHDAGLKIISEHINKPLTSHLVCLSK